MHWLFPSFGKDKYYVNFMNNFGLFTISTAAQWFRLKLRPRKYRHWLLSVVSFTQPPSRLAMSPEQLQSTLEFHTNGRVYTFCHDFLNSVCKRKMCKYIHCTKEEEDLYRKTGVLPDRLKFLADNGLSVLANMHSIPQEIPLCRDYQRGFCERGTCRAVLVQSPPDWIKFNRGCTNRIRNTCCEPVHFERLMFLFHLMSV